MPPLPSPPESAAVPPGRCRALRPTKALTAHVSDGRRDDRRRIIRVHPGTHTLYCDEAGFTGNNLLDHQQPHFAYAAVAVEPDEAHEIVDQVVRQRRIQAGELKASSLVKSARGRATMLAVLKAIEGRYAIAFHHKKYALACKFFEYIFEPALQRNNAFFYELGFNKFIANVLFLHFEVGAATAEELMTEFQELMRARDDSGLRRLFSPASGAAVMDAVLEQMCAFALGYRKEINEELNFLQGSDAVGKWVLDLTSASLVTLLSHWGERLEQMDVYCDHSKPLQAGPGILDAMVGREDRIFMRLAGREALITFNLLRLPQLVDSQTYAGIQLADIASGAAAFGVKHRTGEGRPLIDAIMSHLAEGSVFPELEYADLGKKRPFLNACLLGELARRAQSGLDPLDGIVGYCAFLDRAYDLHPPPTAGGLRRRVRG